MTIKLQSEILQIHTKIASKQSELKIKEKNMKKRQIRRHIHTMDVLSHDTARLRDKLYNSRNC